MDDTEAKAAPAGIPAGAAQLVEKPLFGGKAFRFAGGVRGGGSPLVLNRMPAKGLRQQPVAPHCGSFLGCEADRKARHCSGCRKSPSDFFDSLNPGRNSCRGRSACRKTSVWRKSVPFRRGSTRGRESPRVESNACKRAAAAARCAALRQLFGLRSRQKSEALFRLPEKSVGLFRQPKPRQEFLPGPLYGTVVQDFGTGLRRCPGPSWRWPPAGSPRCWRRPPGCSPGRIPPPRPRSSCRCCS